MRPLHPLHPPEDEEGGGKGGAAVPHGDHRLDLAPLEELHGHPHGGLGAAADLRGRLLHTDVVRGVPNGKVGPQTGKLRPHLGLVAHQEDLHPLPGRGRRPGHHHLGGPVAPHGVQGDAHPQAVAGRCFSILAW